MDLTISNATIELDLNDPFDQVLAEMLRVNRAKRADYAGNRSVIANFNDTAEQVGLTPGHSVELLIATKQSRLRTLLPQLWNRTGKPANEGIEDTLLDRAVYSVIAMIIWKMGGYGAVQESVDNSASDENSLPVL